MADTKKIKRALVSVFHKDGLDALLKKLHEEGVEFLSTGGTRKFIEELGYPCRAVEDVTTYPSILGGRVKTLHPKIFGGILGRRGLADDEAQMAQYGIEGIDLVVVDLYPFEDTVAAGAGALFLWQEGAIKKKMPLEGFRKDLPALGALDRVNAMATLIGFPCYSLGILCGFLWARISWGSFVSGDMKEWVSLIILAVYALLFHQRQALGWRGRKPAILALVIFSASLFSMFVVNTVFPTQHGF